MSLFKVGKQSIPSNLLINRFGWPPFSILNTLLWDWQQRKDEWENLGIFSDEGRELGSHENATPSNIFSVRGNETKKPESVSIFDPFLCELMYKWFSIDGMKILDPFAGGSVRGVVASVLGREYTGIELSEKQVESNKIQYENLLEKYVDVSGKATWVLGDADAELDTLSDMYDMVFTCPPYYNLERYSDDPKDLSNLSTYDAFLNKYWDILSKAIDHLKDDSFFVIVVSEIRKSPFPERSEYWGFVPDTINILQSCGLKYYDEIILENSIGSLPLRAPRYFNQSRKIGRHHQNILVFYKGNLLNIEKKFGEVLP